MRDMKGMVGDVNALRAERDAKNNPPSYEAGQGSGDDWSFLDSPVSENSGIMDDSAYLGSSGGTSSGTIGGNDLQLSMPGVQTQGMQNTQVQKSEDEAIVEALFEFGKKLVGWAKDLVLGFYHGVKDADEMEWVRYSQKLITISKVCVVVSLVMLLFSTITNLFKGSFWFLISSLLVGATGLMIFAKNYEKARQMKQVSQSVSVAYTEEDSNNYPDFEWGSSEEDEVEDDGWGWGDSDEDISEDVASIWGNLEEEETSVVGAVYEEDINIDSAMDSIREITPHTQTRQYLFEEYSRILPLKNPDFAKLKPISENSDNFVIFDKILQNAALQVGTKEEHLPQLVELRENQFIIQLKSTRPSGLKEEDIASEIANIYSKDEFGGILHEGVYATTSSVGANFIINIFKGENSLVTLADTYREVKDFILDPKVKKPIVIGVNELGRVWKFDAEKVYSYIFSGKPRTGKSWGVVGLVVQICMYSSPKEVVFEALDVKDTSSDFYKMNEMLPHFVNFEGNAQRILSRLRYLTTTEAERRKKILKKYDVINIADLKNRGEDVEIPYHYVIVDEMLGLKGKLSKDEDNEFKALINTIVTQMPNLGFRVILVPHRVTNDVIPKTTYTLVGCIACVKSDFKEINTTLEVNKKDFPYSLPNVGDMALKSSEINRGNTVFSHGIAITSTNEGNEGVYKFIGKLWSMLEPVEVKKEEQYVGHDLEDELVDDEDDFWKDVLG